MSSRQGPDLDLVAARVLGCPAVAALHPGPFGEVATYLPGRRISGLRTHGARLEIHVSGVYPHTPDEIAVQIRAAVATAAPAVDVLVVIEDYQAPPAPSSAQPR